MTVRSAKTRSPWAAVLGLVLLAGLIALFVYVLPKVGLEASLMWTAIIGGLGWLISTSSERKAEYRRILAEEKRKLYFEFIDFLLSVMAMSESGKDVELNKEEWRRWSLRLAMVASDDVLRAWNHIKGQAVDPADENRESAEVLKPWGKLLVAMRKDCGHADSAVKPSDLLSVFVNDVHLYRDTLDRP
jgi:hypothetical protein